MTAAGLFCVFGRVWGGSMHRAKNCRCPALQYMQTVRGTEQNPRRKAGDFYDRADGCFIFGRAVLAAFALGGTGDAAPGGAAAGSGGHRLCRRLGGAVRGADALWAGADPWAGRGLLCALCGRGGAGAAAPWAGGALAAQPVSAVCAGRCRGSTLAAAAKVCTRRAGGLRHPDRHGAVLCAGQQRGRPFAVQRGGRSAGGGHRLRAAQICPGAPGHGHAAGGRSRGGGAGQCAVGVVFARGAGVCRRRAGAVLPGAEVCRPERQRGVGCSPLRRRPALAPAAAGLGCATAAAAVLAPGRRVETLAAYAGGCVSGVLCVQPPGNAFGLLFSACGGMVVVCLLPGGWLAPVAEPSQSGKSPPRPPAVRRHPPGWKPWRRAFPRWRRR